MNNSQQATFRGEPQQRKLPPDLMGIVAFSTQAKPIVPLTPVIARALLTAPNALEAGGNTNLTAGLRVARSWLRVLPRHIVRRIVVLGDGEPNIETAALAEEVARCRADWISVDTVFCGDEPTGERVLRSISAATVGGHHFSATTYEQLKQLVVGAAARPHRRQGATVVAVDCSASMSSGMRGGGTRIAAAIAACQSAALIRRTAFARVGAPQ